MLSLSDLAADLRIARTRALRGANVWYLVPVVIAELRLGALAALSRDDVDVDVFIARLGAALPGVEDAAHDTASRDGTRTHAASAWWGELVVRVTLELQRLAGAPAAPGSVVLSAPDDDRWTLAIGYDEETLGVDAVRAAARVMRDLLRGEDPEIAATVRALAGEYESARPDASTRAVIAAARARNIPVRRSLDDDAVQLGLGIASQRVLGASTVRTSAHAARIATDPRRVHRVITGVGIPMPASERARTLDDALESAAALGYPVRLLTDGSENDTTVPLGDEGAVRAAWDALPRLDAVRVERVVRGRAFRVLVVDGRTISVIEQGDDSATDHRGALHPGVAALCELAASAIGLGVAEVCVTTTDIGAPLRATGGVVTAVHADPDLSTYAGAGEAVVEMLYPVGAPTTIPVVAITGTNGKTTTTRLIAHLFRQTGRTVGFTTTDGVYLREQLLMQGDLTGPFAANVILTHPEVEVAVLETARGGILKSGLGVEQCDVAVVMNVTADHLGLRGIETVEQLAQVKAVLPAVVKPGGYAVLNADDALVYAMRARTPGNVALFSVQPAGENGAVEAQLAAGGVVARVEIAAGRERLVILDGARRTDLGASDDVPLTFGGLARFQVQNVLAACAVAYVQGVLSEQIRAGLQGFLPSSAVTPGRLNMVETTRGRVLLDYAHNAAAIRGLFEFVTAMPATRRMALLSAPGDRRDEDLREIGRLAAGLDYVIMKEHDVYRRGRAPGVIAGIMADGLRATGFPDERIATFVEEHEAVSHVMSIMAPGDVVIIIADDTAAVMRQLAEIMPRS